MKAKYVSQAWLVLALALLFGGALAGVQVSLSERIETNKEDDARGRIPVVLFGDRADELADTIEVTSLTIEAETKGRTVPYKVYRVESAATGDLKAWAVLARGQGFADRIELLLVLDGRAERILGMRVILQKETPGLGAEITDGPWMGQFTDKSTARPLRVSKVETGADDEIVAVTGATISSDSVAHIVNQTVAALADELAARAAEPDAPGEPS